MEVGWRFGGSLVPPGGERMDEVVKDRLLVERSLPLQLRSRGAREMLNPVLRKPEEF